MSRFHVIVATCFLCGGMALIISSIIRAKSLGVLLGSLFLVVGVVALTVFASTRHR